MSLSGIACPKCGTNNPATARYCSLCGNILAPVSPGQTVAPSPVPSVPVTPALSAYYGYVASYYETARATAIDRTKTGLLLLVIGFVISWIPIVGAVGVIFELVGAILLILGCHTFGPDHARNVLLSIIIFVIATAVVVVAAIFAVISQLLFFPPGGNLAPPSFFGGFFVGLLVGIAIFGIAEVLFTYALQAGSGRILLWCGYASTIATSSIAFFVLNDVPNVNVISIIPALFYAYAYYLARERIVHGEIPTPSLAPPQVQLPH